MPGHRSQRIIVLHVRGVTGFGGGPEKTILNSPRFLQPLGYRAICAYMHPPNDPGFAVLRQRALEAQAPLISVPDSGPLDWRVVTRLIRLCRQERVTIWHGHDYKSNAIGLVARRFWPMKLVTTVHGWGVHEARTPLYYRIDKLCLRHYDEVVCVSADLYDECRRVGVREANCHLIHNGIDVEQFRRTAPADEVRQSAGVSVQGCLLGAMGRLSAEKGFDLLIRAVDELIRGGLDLSLWIAGEGNARADLEKLIRELGRQDRIRLLGHVERPKEFVEALDMFVLSSRREGLPNVLLEAMALEVPVVATRIAGVPTLIQHDENGLLVEAESVQSLSAGIRRLALDAELRVRLAGAGRSTIEREYSFQHRMEKMAALYDHLLSRNGHTPSRTRAKTAP